MRAERHVRPDYPNRPRRIPFRHRIPACGCPVYQLVAMLGMTPQSADRGKGS